MEELVNDVQQDSVRLDIMLMTIFTILTGVGVSSIFDRVPTMVTSIFRNKMIGTLGLITMLIKQSGQDWKTSLVGSTGFIIWLTILNYIDITYMSDASEDDESVSAFWNGLHWKRWLTFSEPDEDINPNLLNGLKSTLIFATPLIPYKVYHMATVDGKYIPGSLGL